MPLQEEKRTHVTRPHPRFKRESVGPFSMYYDNDLPRHREQRTNLNIPTCCPTNRYHPPPHHATPTLTANVIRWAVFEQRTRTHPRCKCETVGHFHTKKDVRPHPRCNRETVGFFYLFYNSIGPNARRLGLGKLYIINLLYILLHIIYIE